MSGLRRALLGAPRIPPISDSLWIDFWSFDGNSAVGLNGKTVVPFSGASITGNKLQATASNAYITTDAGILGSSDVTICARLFKNGANVLYAGLYGPGNLGLRITTNGEVVIAASPTSNYTVATVSSASIERHYALRYTNSSGSLQGFVDGVQVFSTTISQDLTNCGPSCYWTGGGGNCTVDDLAFYKGLLSDAQIALLAQGGRPS